MTIRIVVALLMLLAFSLAACGEPSKPAGPPSAAGIPNESGRPLIGRHGFLRSCNHAGESAGRCICMADYIEREGGWFNNNYDLYENAKDWVSNRAC